MSVEIIYDEFDVCTKCDLDRADCACFAELTERAADTQTVKRMLAKPIAQPQVHLQCALKAQKNVLTRYYEQLFGERLKELAEEPEKIKEPLNRHFLEELAKRIDLKSSELMFITVNPPEMEEDQLVAFIDRVHNFAHRDKHIGYHYAFETRSDDTSCTGVHFHMLVRLERKTAKSTIAQQTFKHFKNFVPDKYKVCVKAMKNETYIASIQKYIGRAGNGKHTDDAVLRQRFRLKDIYIGGVPIVSPEEGGAGGDPPAIAVGNVIAATSRLDIQDNS